MTESLRFVMLSPRHPSDDSVGVANVISHMARRWAKAGHQVRVCYPRGAPPGDLPAVWEGVQAVPMDLHPRAHVPKSLEAETGKAMAREARSGCDVAISNNEWGADLPSRRRGDGVLALLMMHGLALHFMRLERATRRGIRPRLGYLADLRAVRRLEGGAVARADLVVAVSKKVLHEVEMTYRLDPSRGMAIYNGSEQVPPPALGEREAARASLAIGPEERLAVLVGGDPYRKGLDVAERAVAHLRASGRKVTLVTVGSTPPSSSRESEGVRSLGRVSDAMLRQVLVAGDALLVPSRYEGFPMIAQEAAGLGLPVVASEGSGLDIGTPGRDFLQPASTSAEDWGRALLELLADEPRRTALAARGARVLAQRSYDAMAADYLRAIRRALDAGAPSEQAERPGAPVG
ncbi:MAG: glycosyltransferase family 4 protein [Euryarchaeota archaeon]|nr:glycosyltransferase family 4 protein [Euryarchaeota archaeon]MDE1880941.1 glycosyltransferase family 4 protein [Euryarchaeota archaeon]MDE2046104.1 glycosyltransferase family 4 protein [Thermoplasmata archaeon]